jgi:hypothetical protein
MMRKCNACGGVYEPVQRDGTEYYHVCPPLYEFVNENTGEVIPRDVAVKLDNGEHVDTRVVPRPNARDENVVPGRTPKDKATIKAAGAGVTEL